MTCSDCTINKQTSYQIVLFRKLAPDLSETSWSTQPVPANSYIVITFPSQFTLTGTEACDYVLIDSAASTAYTCSVSTTNKKITITGAIPSDAYIQSVIVGLSGISNPSPALTTSSFAASIGSDTSATDASGGVTLLPGVFENLSIKFDPTTVNSTGNMIVTATLGNNVPVDGYITVAFPQTLLWTRELSLTHKLPIVSTMSCSPIQVRVYVSLEYKTFYKLYRG